MPPIEPPMTSLSRRTPSAPSSARCTWTTSRTVTAGDNAVLVCHALTGSADVADWWGALIGPAGALDPARDFIICSNTLGSCYGTTGPGSPEWDAVFGAQPEAPAVTVRDVVHVQRARRTC